MDYIKLFLSFFKIGAFTFGGGLAMIPLISQEVVGNGWLNENQLIDFVAISESTPGPLAVNMSTYVGYAIKGLFGALLSTLGVVLPSFVIILLVARVYEKFLSSAIVAGAMKMLKPVVIGLIATAVVTTAQSIFSVGGVSDIMCKENVLGVLILAVAFAALWKKINPIWIVVISACMGILIRQTLM